MEKIRVLFIEDDEFVIDLIIRMLKKMPVEIILAKNKTEAERQFEDNINNINLIIMDGSLPLSPSSGVICDTIDFTNDVRKKYSGVIIATSSDPSLREKLMKAGCNIECDDKLQIPEIISNLLNQNKG